LIQQIVGPGIDVIDTGTPVARQVAHLLDVHDAQTSRAATGSLRAFTTGDPECFVAVVRRLCGTVISASAVNLPVSLEGRLG
jgi:glutamate racemase